MAKKPRTRKRKIITGFLITVGSLVVLAVVGGIAALIYIGRDDPAQYEGKVAEIEKTHQDPAPQDIVLLTGSSFFELWTTSEEDLAPLETLNVGIGGTKIGDHIEFVDRLVTPFRPRALVVYAGSNDISGLPFFSKSGDVVAARVQEYVGLVHERFPDLPVYYVAITEAPIREQVRAEIQEANRILKDWADESGEIVFIDTAPDLLTADGEIDASLFGPDRLHFNAAGYEKFAAAIRPVLLADLVGDIAGTSE